MARKYEGAPAEWVEYVPKIWGERDIYADEPANAITMELHWLSKHQLQALQRRRESIRKRLGSDTKADQEHLKHILSENVRNIRNCDSPVDGLPIVTGEDLFERGEEILVLDITQAIIDRSLLEEGMAKKLRSASDISTSQQTKRSVGDVPSVTPQSQEVLQGIEMPKIPSFDGATTKSALSETVTEKPAAPIGVGLPDSTGAQKAS